MAEEKKNMRTLAVLGSTGSIGTQTLDVAGQHQDMFRIGLLTANENVELLAAQALRFGADDAVICNESKYGQLKSLLAGTRTRPHAGMDAVCRLVGGENIDIVVTAMVGFGGLKSTMAAIEKGKTIALANKETLVTAGASVIRESRRNGASIIPVDSEHSAIFQCLRGNGGNKVVKLHLTASGGPFRTWERDRIACAKAADALKHPNWNMGAKVTIDSATMMNKGLEVIEAKWLFDMDRDRINVIVHPQSIIHSMVEYEDGAVIAQLGCPDMREPIQYALSWPARLPLNNKKPDFAAIGHLDFESPDFNRFPCLGIAYEALHRGGNAPTAMNAANEIAVKSFLEDKIRFYDIPELIMNVMDKCPFLAEPSLEDIFSTDATARILAENLLH